MTKHTTSTKKSTWHSVRVFCAFFSLLATFASVMFLTEVRTRHEGLLVILWILGVVAGILVAPGKFFKFGVKVMGVCATFGWFLLPFPLGLATVAASVAAGLAAVLAAVFCFPAAFTIYTYITDLRYDCTDSKKDLMVILTALAATVLAIAAFFSLQGITQAVEKPMMNARFDPVAIYQDYEDRNANAPACPAEVLEAPADTTNTEKGYVRVHNYIYDGQEDGVFFDYTLQVTFEYDNGKWCVTDTEYTSQPTGFAPVSGCWSGTGKFFGNLSYDNRYTVTLDALTQQGGSGTLEIFLEDTIDETLTFDVTVDALRDTGSGVCADLTLTPREALVYNVFGGEDQLTELPFTLSFHDNTFITTAFSFSEIFLTPVN